MQVQRSCTGGAYHPPIQSVINNAKATWLCREECTPHQYSLTVINNAKVTWLCREECTTHRYNQTVINNAKATLNIAISAGTEVCSIQRYPSIV